MRVVVPRSLVTLALVAACGAALTAQESPGLREVTASARSVITLQTKLRYTTLIVLPDGDPILDVLAGDRDRWVISATPSIVHVKPAVAGAETNLHVVTASGALYAFLLREGGRDAVPDLTVVVRAGPPAEAAAVPRYYSAAHVADLTQELADTRAALAQAAREATATVDRVRQEAAEALAASRRDVPTQLRFLYDTPRYERPFFVRAIWHDGTFTYLQADAPELPALYEVVDGAPAAVTFQVRDGTYIVPKVLDRAYLALGKARLSIALRRTR